MLLAGCGHPFSGPVDLFHDLEGGEIAALRPPPPGIGMAYPKLGTVPAKPAVADPGYRRALQAQLAAERDRTERVAADSPIEAVPPPPAPAPTTQAAAAPTANATLDTADAPATPPPALQPAPQPAAVAHPDLAAAPADPGPPAGTPLTILGTSADSSGLPTMPDTPPLPASFEGVSAEPAPATPQVPVRMAATPLGTQLYFPTGSAALPESQTQALKDFVASRHNRGVEILGLGDAASDTPDGQATAVALGLARARAAAAALAGMHVPQGAMRVGADAFGRGVVLRLLP